MKQLSFLLVFYFVEEPTAVYLASLEILIHFLQPNCMICALLSSAVQSRIVLSLHSAQSKKSYKNIPQSKLLQIKATLGQWCTTIVPQAKVTEVQPDTQEKWQGTMPLKQVAESAFKNLGWYLNFRAWLIKHILFEKKMIKLWNKKMFHGKWNRGYAACLKKCRKFNYCLNIKNESSGMFFHMQSHMQMQPVYS